MTLALNGTVNDNQAGILRPRKTATPLIINGDMAIAQRGTSATTIGDGNSGYHVCDRWRFSEVGAPTGEFTISQSTDVPSDAGFKSSLKFDVTTADTSLASNDLYRLEHRTEAQDMKVLNYGSSSAETSTLSFWVKSSKTGTYSFHIRQNDDLRGLTKTYTISSANTWEKKIINLPADTTGVIENDNGIGFQMYWNFATGTDFTGTTQTTWASTADGFVADGQAVNLLDSTSNDWYITGVQLEVGTFDANSIPDFQFEDRGTSLARCQRYCIVYGTGEESFQQLGETGISTSTTQAQIPFNHPTEMRGVPSLSSSGNLALGQGTALIAMTAVAINSNADTRQSTGVIATVASGLTGHKPYRIDQQGSPSSIMIFDSEL